MSQSCINARISNIIIVSVYIIKKVQLHKWQTKSSTTSSKLTQYKWYHLKHLLQPIQVGVLSSVSEILQLPSHSLSSSTTMYSIVTITTNSHLLRIYIPVWVRVFALPFRLVIGGEIEGSIYTHVHTLSTRNQHIHTYFLLCSTLPWIWMKHLYIYTHKLVVKIILLCLSTHHHLLHTSLSPCCWLWNRRL